MKVRMLTITALLTALLLPGLLAVTGCHEEHRDYRERREINRHEERHEEHRDEHHDEH